MPSPAARKAALISALLADNASPAMRRLRLRPPDSKHPLSTEASGISEDASVDTVDFAPSSSAFGPSDASPPLVGGLGVACPGLVGLALP